MNVSCWWRFFQEGHPGVMLRDVATQLRIHPKRAAYICDKWTSKGWYDYGVNVLCGWLTDKGKAAAMNIQEAA